MTHTGAVLLDLYRTIVASDFDAALSDLAEVSGLERTAWVTGIDRHAQALTTGMITLKDAFAATLELAGHDPSRAPTLVQCDAEMGMTATLIDRDSQAAGAVQTLDNVLQLL